MELEVTWLLLGCPLTALNSYMLGIKSTGRFLGNSTFILLHFLGMLSQVHPRLLVGSGIGSSNCSTELLESLSLQHSHVQFLKILRENKTRRKKKKLK